MRRAYCLFPCLDPGRFKNTSERSRMFVHIKLLSMSVAQYWFSLYLLFKNVSQICVLVATCSANSLICHLRTLLYFRK
ncbi:hypothetical protein BD769DRAFT_167317 [Suillus cothurnatus]|nr:hypothetical protein BD769DRAFT_167317 [Suillus cothurnatus]